MNKINDGGPAFPVIQVTQTADGPFVRGNSGMTLRDYFAAKAMQAALHGASLPGLPDGAPEAIAAVKEMARAVYQIADAMLAARGAAS